MHGHTYDTPIEQRIRNLAAQCDKRDVLQAAAKSNGCPHEFERWLSGYAQAACNDSDTGATLAAMENRVNQISIALNAHDLTAEEASELMNEQAELINRIGRAEDDSADDFADMRREAQFGKGL